MTRRLSALPRVSLLLVLVILLSLGLRIALINEPCRAPCRKANDHLLIFDEVYYVNAARVIAGISPPWDQKYTDAPHGDDPNSEHPQLVKVLMAGSIELLGDNPLAWRLCSLVFGTVAILAMFALARAAGGSDDLALIAAGLMAADNLLLVHGRIGTLDVPVLAMMLCAAVAYLRDRPLLAGVLLGIGSAMKLVAPYLIVVIVLLELLRGRAGWRAAAARIAWCTAAGAVVFLALLTILDRLAPAYDPATLHALGHSPFVHLSHMLTYGADQTSPNGPTGIASYPWAWLIDLKPITYLNINPSKPAPGLFHVHPAAHFIGMMSPAVMVLALPSLVFGVWALWRGRSRARADSASGSNGGPGSSSNGGPDSSSNGGPDSGSGSGSGEVPRVAMAWFLGTFLPFVGLSVVFERTSYLYYMVIVMPGIYLAVSDVLVRLRRHWRWLLIWVIALVGSLVALYPFTPLP